jgi:type VI secretion system protein VasG
MSNDLSSLISKLNPICRRGLEGAAALCINQTHYDVEIEHLLLKLLEDDGTDILAILRHFDLDPANVIKELTKAMDGFKRGNGRTPALSPHLTRLIEAAWMQSSLTLGEGVIRSGSLLLALGADDSLRALLLTSSITLMRIPRAEHPRHDKGIHDAPPRRGRRANCRRGARQRETGRA